MQNIEKQRRRGGLRKRSFQGEFGGWESYVVSEKFVVPIATLWRFNPLEDID